MLNVNVGLDDGVVSSTARSPLDWPDKGSCSEHEALAHGSFPFETIEVANASKSSPRQWRLNCTLVLCDLSVPRDRSRFQVHSFKGFR